MKKLKNILSIFMLMVICFTFGCGNSKVNNSKKITYKNSISEGKLKKGYSSHNSLGEDKKNAEVNNQRNNKNNDTKSQCEKDNKSSTIANEKKNSDNTIIKKKINKNSSNTKTNGKSQNNNDSDKVSKVNKSGKSSSKDVSKDEDTFTLIVSRDLKGYMGKTSQVILKKRVKICNKKNAMTYLRDNCSINDKGGFIYEINGIHNVYPIPASKKTPEQKKLGILGMDWFIYLNDKKTPVGANDVYPKGGEVLLLDFHEWDKREFSSSSY